MTRDAISDLRHWQASRDSDNILWLYLDRKGKGVNALGREVLEELESIVTHCEKDTPRGLAILSGKRSGFVYGADVHEFEGYESADDVKPELERAHGIFNRLEKLSCPTVAAIEGYCLGGGLEMALACDYRIAKDTADTKLGFPETQLGIYPGFGGSARSVQRIGGMKAMQLMLTARNISPRAARGMGLIDEVIGRHQELNWAARRAILKDRKSSRPALVARLSNRWPARQLLAAQMRKKTASKVRPEHYPAPFRLIDNWKRFGNSKKRMLDAEISTISELMVTPEAQGLRRVFSLMEKLKAQGKKSDFRVRRVHVIGVGVMGGDIAAWCVLNGLEATLQDLDEDKVKSAMKRAEDLFRKKLRDSERVKGAMARLRPDLDGELIRHADVVIEAIVEKTEAKQKLFREVEPKLREGAVLATNTSSIQLEELAEVLEKPSRLIGLHFFNPVAKLPLVEVVRGKDTDDELMERGAAFCGQIKRFPLPVKSSPGFLVNRVLAPYMMEALTMYHEGIPKEAIDEAAEAFGMPMGPVELADSVGLDICLSVTKIVDTDEGSNEDSDESSPEAELIEKLVDDDKLGKKSGEGFYKWKDGKPQKDSSRVSGHDLKELSDRLIKAYTGACREALEEDIVEDEDLLDAGMVFGTGFPPFRGGPMYYLAHRDEQYKVPSSGKQSGEEKDSSQESESESGSGSGSESESESEPESRKKSEAASEKDSSDKDSADKDSSDQDTSAKDSSDQDSSDKDTSGTGKSS